MSWDWGTKEESNFTASMNLAGNPPPAKAISEEQLAAWHCRTVSPERKVVANLISN